MSIFYSDHDFMIQGGDFINEVIRIKEVNASKLYHKQIPD
jgi:hypothetical protein